MFTLKDRLAHLTYREACKLLGHEGESLIKKGGNMTWIFRSRSNGKIIHCGSTWEKRLSPCPWTLKAARGSESPAINVRRSASIRERHFL